MTASLTTERLLLRPWTQDDAPALYEYARDPAVGPVAGWPPHTSVEESRRILETILCVPETYAVCRKTDGAPIGSIGLHRNSDLATGDDECELGYWLGRPFWGHGIMTEAARRMIEHAFVDLGVARVWCGYYDGNVRSARVQQKCGFRYRWTTPDVPAPQLHETRIGHVNCLTAAEWRAMNA